MKTLTLLRHAKSSWEIPGIADFDRPLNGRGTAAAARMGRELLLIGMSFDMILASPARRVVETLQRLSQQYEGMPSPRFDQQVYAATPERLLDLVRAADDRIARLLVVGHNPGLQQLAIGLTRGDKGQFRPRLLAKFPTAALAEISIATDHWHEAGTAGATVTRYIQPRDLPTD